MLYWVPVLGLELQQATRRTCSTQLWHGMAWGRGRAGTIPKHTAARPACLGRPAPVPNPGACPGPHRGSAVPGSAGEGERVQGGKSELALPALSLA